ncbi:MAG: hypothetical protein ABSB84_11095 [Verrucomicrobiota bacterium]
MPVIVNHRFKVNPFKIRLVLQTIPIADCLADGFFALDSVMPDFAFYDPSSCREFVVPANRRERTVRDAVRSLQNNRTSTSLPEKLLCVVGHVMKIILRPARCETLIFCLSDVHTLSHTEMRKRSRLENKASVRTKSIGVNPSTSDFGPFQAVSLGLT